MKEKVLEALDNLGFTTEQIDENAYNFKYEGLSLFYLYSPDDEEFLSIALPGVYDFDENDIGKYRALTESINSALKYIKAYTIDKSMWLFYEREILEGENIKEIIRRMIFHLQAGLLFLRKTINSYDSDGEEGGDGDTANDSED